MCVAEIEWKDVVLSFHLGRSRHTYFEETESPIRVSDATGVLKRQFGAACLDEHGM